MHTDLQKNNPLTIPTGRFDERRGAQRTPLMLTAWIWRTEAPDEGLAIRLLNHSETGVGFISPLPLDVGESFGLSLEHTGVRRTGLKVTNCEFFSDNAFRIGATVVPATPAAGEQPVPQS